MSNKPHSPRGRKSVKDWSPEPTVDDDSLDHSGASGQITFEECSPSDDTSGEEAEGDKSPGNRERSRSFSPKGKGGKAEPQRSDNSVFHFLAALVVLFGFVIGGSFLIGDDNNNNNNVKCQFDPPTDNKQIWLSLNSGITEVKEFKKPSVFLYIYNDVPENYVDALIRDTSRYAACKLTNNDESIELTHKELNGAKATKDYGYLIDHYRTELEAKKVMVVKHLETVPGQVARAFHSFCDEISPLVKESLIIFTMKVDKLPKKTTDDYNAIEETLRKKWPELNEDILVPLVTRITGTIERIRT